MKVTIKKVDGTDNDTVNDLTYLHDSTFASDAHVPNFSRGHWWIAYCGSLLVGFAGLADSHSAPGYGYLKRSGVLPQYRGRRLQRRLITARERWARGHGLLGLVTDTTENPASANSLIGRGYRIYEPKKPWTRWKQTIYWHKRFQRKENK